MPVPEMQVSSRDDSPGFLFSDDPGRFPISHIAEGASSMSFDDQVGPM
jgi:hypothetical protein